VKCANWTTLFISIVLSGFFLAIPGCGGGSSADQVSSGGVTLTGLEISPTSQVIQIGDTLQFTGKAHFSDATTQDVTKTADWSSSASDIADIGGTFDIDPGVADGKAPGVTTITLSFAQGSRALTSSTNLTVTPVLTSVDILPLDSTIQVGDFQQFTGTAHFRDGTSKDVTNLSDWSSSATNIADIQGYFDDAPGLAEGDAAGVTTITVRFMQGSGDVKSSTSLTVTAASGNSTKAPLKPRRVATVSFVADPGASIGGLKVDGRTLSNSSAGAALSVELPAGHHRFSSADGRHAFSIILHGQHKYSFRVLSSGRLALRDPEAEAR
jgi:hypothetical protein